MSTCDVCIGVDSPDDGAVEVIAHETRKARKLHKCEECRKQINPGEEYEYVFGKFDGEMYTFTTCVLCREIRDVFTCGQSFYYGQLWEEMNEHGFEKLTTASPCFTKLSPSAKDFILERWRKWKGLR